VSEGTELLLKALAGLVNAGAKALESYTQLQEKRAEYFDNAAKQSQPVPDKPFEQFEPGYFERTYGKSRE
jgi:hypothetical protein